MSEEGLERLERQLLLHLLEHRGQQVRFEASQWTTEFGIQRKFASENALALKQALRALEMGRLVYRRTQYVVGYSEPKHVYSLTAVGHRKALEYRRDEDGVLPSAPPQEAESGEAAVVAPNDPPPSVPRP